jgi:FKBP-type peptidyl-prolyl cis-trans isomerase
MEAGLNEGLRLLKPGGEAIFIIPSFLAYGLLGDRKMIPSRAIIVYSIKVNIPGADSIPPR